MDQATPSNLYLTLCLYVSFYFLFFSTATTAAPSSTSSATNAANSNNRNDSKEKHRFYTSSSLKFRIPTDQELRDKRRATSFSEQLDPFLLATRQAQARKQLTGVARSRAKATFGTVSSVYHRHQRSHSRQHFQQDSLSTSHSRQHSKDASSSTTTTHSKQNLRQRGHHGIRTPGDYFARLFTSPAAEEVASDCDIQVLQHPQSQYHAHLHHQQQEHLSGYPNQHHQQQQAHHLKLLPPPRPPWKLSRQGQKRYYHFYPEEPLFRKKTMNVPAAMVPEISVATTSSQEEPKVSSMTSVEAVPMPQRQKRPAALHSEQQHMQQLPQQSVLWTDWTMGNEQVQIPMQEINQGYESQSMEVAQQALTQTTSDGQAAAQRTTLGRYELKCHLEESVTPPTLLAHLRMLRLVQSLVIVDDEDLDFLFLIRSEERYLMFLDMLQQLAPPAHAVPLPPLDIALMWMVHMLAPFRYHEDLLRSYNFHLLDYAFPLERYVAAVDIENPSTSHEAFAPSKAMWQQLYPEEAFDLDKDDTNRMFEIQCLWCGGTNVMDSSTYIKFRIDGMSIDCAGCGSQCSLETLSSKRLWDGIEAYRADSSILLAGSLLSPWTGTPDVVAAQREHHHLFFHPRIQFGLDQASVSLNCTWPKVVHAFQDLGPDQYYGVRPTTLARIMSSYMGLVEDRLSMDLVAGALRQRDFQKAMMVTGGLAWCQPQVLQRSLDRYKKFVLLSRAESKHAGPTVRVRHGSGGIAGMSTLAPGGGMLGAGQPGRHALVPTLDIDLAWHTHMLSPAQYRQYQLVHYGRVLNHDDTVQATSTMTKQDFVRTAELWQYLYQERYSSQQTWKGTFKMTPGKLCAGVCFPPFGVYLIWKSWKSKRKAKQLNREDNGGAMKRKGRKSKSKDKKQQSSSSGNNSEKGSARESTEGSDIPASFKTKDPEKGPDMTIEQLAIQEEASPSQSINEMKGKGKSVSGSEADAVDQGVIRDSSQSDDAFADKGSKNLTPGLGLDGRLSNWNGDAAGPDG
ncbi:hypothetical protein EDD11_004569 [Mortierella claussenii]|nr:hypothetical protein EDD11_004569 [Mortierella claussenii]